MAIEQNVAEFARASRRIGSREAPRRCRRRRVEGRLRRPRRIARRFTTAADDCRVMQRGQLSCVRGRWRRITRLPEVPTYYNYC